MNPNANTMNTTTAIPSFFSATAASSSSSAPEPMQKSKGTTPAAAAAAATTKAKPAKAVRAILRVRPPLGKEKSAAKCLHLDPHDPTVVNLNDNGTWSQYTLDHCLPRTATQDDVFAHVQPMLDDAFAGVSATVFAYGMTGSGKTYTIEGNADNRGVVYRSAQYLFAEVPRVKKVRKWAQVEVHMAMFELYMDTIEDLLVVSRQAGSARAGAGATAKGKAKAKAKAKDVGNGAGATGSALMGAIRSKLVADTCQEYREVRTRQVADYDQFVALYQRGLKSRATGATNLNAKSSRSHLFVQLVLVSRSALPTADITFAKVNLVDLAGSENNKKTGNEGKRMDESKAINSSLFDLDQVVTALNRTKRGHVPYGNSKLTKILKDSLGGSAQALIIANAGPSVSFVKETKATLAFATKSVTIINTPVTNTVAVAPAPPAATSSRKRSAPTDSTPDDPSPPSPKRPRTDPGPDLVDIKKGLTNDLKKGLVDLKATVEANMEAKMAQLVTAAVSKMAQPQPHATPARRAMSKAGALAAVPAHTPCTARSLANDLLALARGHARKGNFKLARVHFESVLADKSVDRAIREVCVRELAACGAAHVAAGVGGKGKRRRVVDDSDDDDDSKIALVSVSPPLTPRSRSRAEALARANEVLAKYGATPLPKMSSGLATAPPLSFTIPDSPVPNSPSASKSSGGRAKRAKSSGTLPDLTMSPRATAYFLGLVNCRDPVKISARFPRVGNGKAKLIVDHVTMHGGIRAASDLLGIVGFGEKTVMSMVETARAAVGERAVVGSVQVGAAVPVEEGRVVASGIGVGVGVGVGAGKENASVGGEGPRKKEGKGSGSGSGSGSERTPVVWMLDD